MESARAQARLNKFLMYLVLVIMAFIMLVTVIMQRAEKKFVFYN